MQKVNSRIKVSENISEFFSIQFIFSIFMVCIIYFCSEYVKVGVLRALKATVRLFLFIVVIVTIMSLPMTVPYPNPYK